jgi:hypothetical protein
MGIRLNFDDKGRRQDLTTDASPLYSLQVIFAPTSNNRVQLHTDFLLAHPFHEYLPTFRSLLLSLLLLTAFPKGDCGVINAWTSSWMS